MIQDDWLNGKGFKIRHRANGDRSVNKGLYEFDCGVINYMFEDMTKVSIGPIFEFYLGECAVCLEMIYLVKEGI
jgi:hypothetical protein